MTLQSKITPASRERQPIKTAPRDGTPIRAFYDWDDGDEADEGVYFAEQRQCILGSRAGERGPGWVSPEIGHLPVEPTHWLPMNAPAPARPPQTYADYLSLGMQKADKALPGGSAERKAEYASSYANSRAPVELTRPPERTYADFLEEARVRQAGAGRVTKFCSSTDDQLAQADAQIGWTNERARQRHAAKGQRA